MKFILLDSPIKVQRNLRGKANTPLRVSMIYSIYISKIVHMELDKEASAYTM